MVEGTSEAGALEYLKTEGAVMEQGHERWYAIKSPEGYFFYAGLTPNKEQVLMGLFCPNLVA
jgi:hypothetical protein